MHGYTFSFIIKSFVASFIKSNTVSWLAEFVATKPSNFIEENGAAFDAENLSMVEYNHSPSKLPLVLNTNGKWGNQKKRII